ncbi:MAG: GTP-binding protein [Erysipelotrichaceae bacterium]|nr:GTP-binding protein [Erysipelotrichaceae bacterium]
MKILIVSGFLGAGKTTFIKELALKSQKHFCILENEYASLDIDSDRLRDDVNLNIYELNEKCVCCSTKNDIASSILTIANTIDPEFLVIEPSGVAYLNNVINRVNKVLYERIILLAPITIVSGNEMIDEKVVYNQIKEAKTIIVSKMEQASYDKKEKLYSLLNKEFFDNLLKTTYDNKVMSKEETVTNYDTVELLNLNMSNISKAIVFMEDIIHGRYGNIIRAKGGININNIKYRFDVVDGYYSIQDFENFENNAVFIGHNLVKNQLKNDSNANLYNKRQTRYQKNNVVR